jgi:hypothetical protein
MTSKSSWVPLVLRVYSHLLQLVPCIMATARTASLQLWMRSETMGMVFLCCLIYDAFLEMTLNWHVIWTMCDVGFQTILLLLHLNLGCNNYVELRCMWTICELVVTCDMYVEPCTILIVCWQWFEILRDTRWTTVFIWAQVCACQHVSGDRHSWSCINWSVLLQLASAQDSTLTSHMCI